MTAGVVIFVAAIVIVVMIHESGHFFTAKAFGIKVTQFFVGFGPRLWSTRRGETEYGIKAFPFGGYVRIAGMNPFEEVPVEEQPRTFQAKPIWQRAVVIATGPVTHFFMAVVIAAVFLIAVGVPDRFHVEIGSVEPRLNGNPSPAAVAGLRAGDRVVAVGGRSVPTTSDASGLIIRTTRGHVGRPLDLEVLRGDRRLSFQVTPVLSDVDGEPVGRIGTILVTEVDGYQRYNPIAAVGRGAVATYDTAVAVIGRLGDVFGPSGLKRIFDQLTGAQPRGAGDVQSVVGGGRTLVQAASEFGFWPAFLQLLISFNVFIGILNLVPLPPLDGGHLAVLAYEKVRRRRPDIRKLIPLTAVVAAFMILFAISITYLDIVSPLPNQFR